MQARPIAPHAAHAHHCPARGSCCGTASRYLFTLGSNLASALVSVHVARQPCTSISDTSNRNHADEDPTYRRSGQAWSCMSSFRTHCSHGHSRQAAVTRVRLVEMKSGFGNIDRGSDFVTWLSDVTAVLVQQDLHAPGSRRWSTWRPGCRWRGQGGEGTRGAPPPWPPAILPWRTATGPTAGRSCVAPWPSWGRSSPGVCSARPAPRLQLPLCGPLPGKLSGHQAPRLRACIAMHLHDCPLSEVIEQLAECHRYGWPCSALLLHSWRRERTPEACEPDSPADPASGCGGRCGVLRCPTLLTQQPPI